MPVAKWTHYETRADPGIRGVGEQSSAETLWAKKDYTQKVTIGGFAMEGNVQFTVSFDEKQIAKLTDDELKRFFTVHLGEHLFNEFIKARRTSPHTSKDKGQHAG